MLAIFSLLVILTISILVTRIATVALVHTGLSREVARFQSRSAFTGVGFTTQESEKVVNHPVRRKILMLLMFLGNVGFVSTISTLVLGFMDKGEPGAFTWLFRLGILATGVVLLWLLAISHWVDRWLSRVISWALRKWSGLEVMDYYTMLNLSGEYRVSSLHVNRGDWLASKKLSDLLLNKEGILVLGIRRTDESYVGTPTGDTEIEPGDTLILYGRDKSIRDLDERSPDHKGDISHKKAVEEQKEVVKKQEKAENIRKGGNRSDNG